MLRSIDVTSYISAPSLIVTFLVATDKIEDAKSWENAKSWSTWKIPNQRQQFSSLQHLMISFNPRQKTYSRIRWPGKPSFKISVYHWSMCAMEGLDLNCRLIVFLLGFLKHTSNWMLIDRQLHRALHRFSPEAFRSVFSRLLLFFFTLYLWSWSDLFWFPTGNERKREKEAVSWPFSSSSSISCSLKIEEEVSVLLSTLLLLLYVVQRRLVTQKVRRL